MPEASTFDELIRRVRAWDQEAAAELVRRYEPAIRRAVRFRLADARLGGLLDSMDICQSVLGSFFVRAAAGQYDLETPEQVLGLLAAMARNKLASQARRQGARAAGTAAASPPATRTRRSGSSTPAPARAGRWPRATCSRRSGAGSSPDERRLLELRNDGHDWAAIAARLGGSAEALRKKLARALDRVAEQLGLDDEP